ncbi:NAD(P)/FAD-dependent oxidoreductase [Gordonia sp. OPL2]|uniref:flavin-containing monooxygenase n=1 Tax=Gordonia sp. OPL2 TaxID=2486274 RepID=UPI0016556BC3|nr:NAD(P)-binding domain-containing protein [Gordonia sp. OPL2]RPA19842.1 dimethylaniline monooxygenase [Gordonia sp. OPL2]
MKVCVVGAGPCGLTTIKQLLDEGHEVVCYEKNDDIGGIWLRHDRDAGQTKAFDNLLLTISMKLMAYSDLPFDGGRVFASRGQYFGYLEEYADRFGLREHIRFGHVVTDVARGRDDWTVSASRNGVDTREVFDAVAICSGPFKTPNTAIAGLEDFTGEIVHSADYRNSDRFRGRRVLIVGLAESGADIVREIGDVAASCTLAIRSYTYLLPRIHGNRTTDQGTVRAHHHEMCRRATDQPFALDSFWGRSGIAKAVFLTAALVYGFAATMIGAIRDRVRPRPAARRQVDPMGQPADPPMLDVDTLDNEANWDLIRTWNRRSHPDGSWAQRGIFCKNVSFVPGIVAGRIILNDKGIQRSDGNRVFFGDSTVAEFDAIVLCTGYTTEKLAIGDLQVKDGNVRTLYKHFLHPEHQGSAAFIGFVRPFSGGIPICAEMQARYFAQLCSGKVQIPDNIDEVIGREKEWEEYWTELSPRHTEAIPSQILYLDALAREIGCLVPMRRLVLDPKLFVQIWFGSFNPSCYRIVGPHSRGRAALDDLYSEPVENRGELAFRTPLRQLLPSSVHPKHAM